MMQSIGGRRPLTSRDIALAVIAGFCLSFVVLFFAMLFPADVFFHAQLLVGGPMKEYPTTLDYLVVNRQFQVATAALGSLWFWVAVIVAGFFMMWWLLRCFRS